jgi:peptide/nickel transport system ATP-binding protein
VTLSVHPGQLLAIVGESGSGKSTLLRLLALLAPPSSGSIWFCGTDLTRASREQKRLFRRDVQLIYQDPFASLNPVRNIAYHLARPLYNSGRRSATESPSQQLHELLALVGLDGELGLLHRYPHQLSGGQRQRVAIARALAMQPKLLLADEPTSMLDVSIRMGILNLLKQLRKDKGIACLYITHDVASARYVADDLRVMQGGHIVEAGATEEVLAKPAHPYTQLLLASVPGSPRTKPGAPARGASLAFTSSAGCPFVGQCPLAMRACTQSMPQPTRLGESHWARCHALDK